MKRKHTKQKWQQIDGKDSIGAQSAETNVPHHATNAKQDIV